MRSSCYFLNIGSGIYCMFSKRSVNIWTFDKKDPYGKYSNCTSHYYRRCIHYFSLNSLYFFFLRFSHFHSRSLLYHRTIICREVTKTPQYFQPLRIFVVNIVTASQPPKHRKKTNAASRRACCVSSFSDRGGLTPRPARTGLCRHRTKGTPNLREYPRTPFLRQYLRPGHPRQDRKSIRRPCNDTFSYAYSFEFDLFRTNVTSFFGKTKSEIPIPPSAETIAVPNRPNRRPLSADEARPFTTTARSPHSRTPTLRKSASAIVPGQSPSAVRATASVR